MLDTDPPRIQQRAELMQAPQRFAAPRRRPRKAKPVLLGKRGAPLEYAECIHRTTTADDVCLNCGRYVGEDKPVPPRRRPPRRKPWPPTFPRVPVPEQHYKIAKQLYQRRTGVTVAELAKMVELERHEVQNGLQYLEQNGLAVCHGRRAAARWAATVLLRRMGPKSGALHGDRNAMRPARRKTRGGLSRTHHLPNT